MPTTLDVQNLIFSLIIVRPRKPFFEWLEPILAKQGFTLEQVYFPQEDGVWIIPAIGTFADTQTYNDYINKLKAIITRQEMGKFGPEPNEMPTDFSNQTCEAFFEFEIRDNAQIAP